MKILGGFLTVVTIVSAVSEQAESAATLRAYIKEMIGSSSEPKLRYTH
jgi:hypothetical protein